MKSQIAIALIGLASIHADVYQGTPFDDVLQGAAANDWMTLGEGGDIGEGSAGDDILFGEAGHDQLHGDGGNDILVGGSAVATGDTASNVMVGGGGDDFLLGGMYGDTYRYNIGDGFDRIREPGTWPGETDRIIFGAGIAASSLGYSRDRGDLFVELASGDILRIESWYGSSNGEFRIEEFQFDSDTPLSGATLPFDGTTWTGTANADSYIAPVGANYWILGSAGNDTLTGNTGMDVLVGGPGNDTLYGRDGNDGIYGEGENDTLNGESGNDTVDGGSGIDVLTGGAGDDQLRGGTGNDTLNGGAGNDIYPWNLGDGDDVIQDDYGSTGQGAANRLVFGPGISPADVTTEVVPTSASHVKFVIRQNGGVVGSVTVNFWTFGNPTHRESWRIDFADGTTWNAATHGTTIAETFNGTAVTDTLSGAGGNDTLNGLDGDDALNGEADNDTLNGGNGNDTLNGGSGNDMLNGGAGNDIYPWSLGDGADVIQDDYGSTGQGAANRLVFGPGILASDVTTEVVPNSSSHVKFVIRQNGGVVGSVTVNFWTFGSPAHRESWRIDFADGTTWNAATLGTAVAETFNGTAYTDTLNGGGGNDTLNGLDGDDVLNGEADNDTLNGGNGNDTLNGGSGNDTLNGGAGNDIYPWSLGDGADVIQDDYGSTGQGAVNRLVFGPGILASDVTTEVVPNSASHVKFVIRQNGGVVGSVTVNFWTFGSPAHRESWRIDFADGTTWNAATQGTVVAENFSGTAYTDTLNGGGGNDTLNGLDGDDVLNGEADNDTLNGSNGNDTLNGGSGNDRLNGDAGDDAYIWNLGDGDDVVQDDYWTTGQGAVNRLVFGPGILATDVTAETVPYYTSHIKFVVRQNGVVNGSIIINYWTYVTHAETWQITFSTGDTYRQSFLPTPVADVILGTAGADHFRGYNGTDILYGYAGDDILVGGPGDDLLVGAEGSDTYIFDAGDDSDRIQETAEPGLQNVIWFGAGIVPGEVEVLKLADSIVFFHRNSSLTVEILGWTSGGSALLAKAVFADGTEWDTTQINLRATDTSDSNGDGITDAVAYKSGFEMRVSDSDGDGISNTTETAAGTSAFHWDSDGDGVTDAEDMAPLDPCIWQLSAPDSMAPMSIAIRSPLDAIITD